MKSDSCSGCKHIRQYSTTKKHFCSNSKNAEIIEVRGESFFIVTIESLDDISCSSYKKGG